MKLQIVKTVLIGSAFTVGFAGVTPAAEAPAQKGWQDTAELSYVNTSGNSRSSALGFKNKLWRAWESSALEFNAGGVRVETTSFNRQAIGTLNDFRVDNNAESKLSAENYFANGRYNKKPESTKNIATPCGPNCQTQRRSSP